MHKQAKACGLDLEADGGLPNCAGFSYTAISFPVLPLSLQQRKKSRRVFSKLFSDVLNRPHSSGPLYSAGSSVHSLGGILS